MLIQISTLTINHAFLQEIKEDNVQLQELFSQLRYITCQPRQTLPKNVDLLTFLCRLRDQLAMHFALEEAFGYFEDAVAVAPRLSEAAQRLRGEHGELYRAICDLTDRADQHTRRHAQHRPTEDLVTLLAEFHDRFQAHENRECELILQAFDDDIGVGD